MKQITTHKDNLNISEKLFIDEVITGEIQAIHAKLLSGVDRYVLKTPYASRYKPIEIRSVFIDKDTVTFVVNNINKI